MTCVIEREGVNGSGDGYSSRIFKFYTALHLSGAGARSTNGD